MRSGQPKTRRPEEEQTLHAQQATQARHPAGRLPPPAAFQRHCRRAGTAAAAAGRWITRRGRGRRSAARAYGKCSPGARARRPLGGGERLRERGGRARPIARPALPDPGPGCGDPRVRLGRAPGGFRVLGIGIVPFSCYVDGTLRDRHEAWAASPGLRGESAGVPPSGVW